MGIKKLIEHHTFKRIVMHRPLKVCHERVLPRDLFQPQPTLAVGDAPERAVIFFRKLWINGTTLRVRFMGGTTAKHDIAREQAYWWTEHANMKFDFNEAPDAEIRVSFDRNDGAWSYLGTDCRDIPLDQPTMNLGFLDGGTVAHEFGHALGLGHEHQNPAGGGIDWNEEVVIRDLGGPPNYWSPDQVRHNVLEKYSVDQIRGTEFDPSSIMLYFFPSSWTTSGISTKANNVLSALDKAFIASDQAYPRSSVVATAELIANAPPIETNIGQPGEEDLFIFNAANTGRHVFSTGGQTDVVMKLFGPNSQTNLIAEDDDGGWGLNSRISIRLVPGQYAVQIRHYNKARGTGKYSIRVQR